MIDDFEWQAQELAYNWQLSDDFEWEWNGEVTRANAASIIESALKSYAEWLSDLNFTLLILRSNASKITIGAFILPNRQIDEFKLLAKRLGLQYNTMDA